LNSDHNFTISNDFRWYWSPVPCILQHWVCQQSQSVFLQLDLKSQLRVFSPHL
jgi:hypothetical protein